MQTECFLVNIDSLGKTGSNPVKIYYGQATKNHKNTPRCCSSVGRALPW